MRVAYDLILSSTRFCGNKCYAVTTGDVNRAVPSRTWKFTTCNSVVSKETIPN